MSEIRRGRFLGWGRNILWIERHPGKEPVKLLFHDNDWRDLIEVARAAIGEELGFEYVRRGRADTWWVNIPDTGGPKLADTADLRALLAAIQAAIGEEPAPRFSGHFVIVEDDQGSLRQIPSNAQFTDLARRVEALERNYADHEHAIVNHNTKLARQTERVDRVVAAIRAWWEFGGGLPEAERAMRALLAEETGDAKP